MHGSTSHAATTAILVPDFQRANDNQAFATTGTVASTLTVKVSKDS